jgi:YGGT family
MSQQDQQVSETRTTQRDPSRDQRVFTFKATYVIWLVLVMLESLLALRVGLKLIGANESSPFAMLIYGVSELFVMPFAGLIGAPAAGGMVLEISSLIAMIVYALVFWVIERIVWVTFYRPREAPVSVTQRSSTDQRTK